MKPAPGHLISPGVPYKFAMALAKEVDGNAVKSCTKCLEVRANDIVAPFLESDGRLRRAF